MAGNVNKVILVGRLGRDPETRNVASGSMVANLRLATSESWKKDGERQERTEWHTIVVWDKLAEIVAQYAVKGSLLYVEGQLRTRKWKDKDGNDRYSTEIEVPRFGGVINILDKAAGGGRDTADAASGSGAAPDLSDDIPF
jgi:single-strand DNA-binding protein